MAASYQAGTASSPVDLLQKIITWLVAQGWTIDFNAAEGSGWRAHLHKSGIYTNMRAAMDERIWPALPSGYHDSDAGYGIGLYLGDGHDGGDPWNEQVGGPQRADGSTAGCGMNLPSGPVAAYHFFDDGSNHIAIVVERAPGIFCHMGWGPSMVKMGFSANYWYFFGSSSAYRNVVDATLPGDRRGITISAAPPMAHSDRDPASQTPNYGDQVHANAFVRVDAAVFTSRWVSNAGYVWGGYGWTGRYMRCALNLTTAAVEEGQYPCYRYIEGRAHQVAFAGAPLLPLHCFVLTDPGARWAPLGFPPSVLWCDGVGHGYAKSEIYQVGGLDYMLFPHFAVRKAA